MTWDKFPLNKIEHLKLMGREMANAWIVLNHPEVTDEERKKFITEVVPVIPTTPAPDKYQRKFIAAAWLCGASLRQLGFYCGNVTPQTILRKLDRELRVPDHSAIRLAPPNVSYERVEELRNVFYRMVREFPDSMEVMSALTIAQLIMAGQSQVVDEANAYTAADTVTKRVEGEAPVEEVVKSKDSFSPKDFDWSVVKP